MKNIPKIIYLNMGEELSEVEDFNDCEGVTWSKKSIDNDVEYYSFDILKKVFEAGMAMAEWQCRSLDPKFKPRTLERLLTELNNYKNDTSSTHIKNT